MTLAEILSNGYGIDIDTLKFEFRTDLELDGACTKEEVMKSLKEDDIIVNGEWIEDFDIVPDEPNGYVELYPAYDDFANEAEGRCAQNDW